MRNSRLILVIARFSQNIVIVTRQIIVGKLGDYLRGNLPLAALVDWAEDAMCDGEFDPVDDPTLAAVVARVGVADVRAFGLTWEECREMLRELGVRATVDLAAA